MYLVFIIEGYRRTTKLGTVEIAKAADAWAAIVRGVKAYNLGIRFGEAISTIANFCRVVAHGNIMILAAATKVGRRTNKGIFFLVGR
jgi:hypothetical protein